MPKKKSNIGRSTNTARRQRLARKAASPMSQGWDRKKKFGNNINSNLIIAISNNGQ